MPRFSWIFALLWLSVSVPVSASDVELSLFGGYRAGGPSVEVPVYYCIASPCPQPSVDARDGEAFGLILDVPFRDKLMFEILLSHQSGDFEDDGRVYISAQELLTSVFPPPRKARFDLTHLHLGLLREWRSAKVSPFAAVGIGIAQLESDRPFFFFDSIDEDRLSASLAGGVKVRLNDWLGLRVEGRGYWSDMPKSVGEDLFQLELSSGLSFKL